MMNYVCNLWINDKQKMILKVQDKFVNAVSDFKSLEYAIDITFESYSKEQEDT